MFRDDTVRHRKSHPHAFKISLSMQPLERTKKGGRVLAIEPHTIVLDDDDNVGAPGGLSGSPRESFLWSASTSTSLHSRES